MPLFDMIIPHHSHPQMGAKLPALTTSELDQNRHGDAILGMTQVREPRVGRRTCAAGDTVQTSEGPRRAVVAPWRRDPTRAAPVRYVRMTMIELPAERDVLAGHVVVGSRHIPGLERV